MFRKGESKNYKDVREYFKFQKYDLVNRKDYVNNDKQGFPDSGTVVARFWDADDEEACYFVKSRYIDGVRSELVSEGEIESYVDNQDKRLTLSSAKRRAERTIFDRELEEDRKNLAKKDKK